MPEILFEHGYDPTINWGGPHTPEAESAAIWQSWADYYASVLRPTMSDLYHQCCGEIVIRNERYAALGAPLLTAPSRHCFIRLIKRLDQDGVRLARHGRAPSARSS
jgi:hypothetical protein